MTAPLEPLVDLREVKAQCDATRQAHRAMANRAPWVRLWANPPDDQLSRGLILRGVVNDSISGSFPFTIKDPATGTLRLRLDHYLAKWLISIPDDPEAKKNVVISVDYMGRGKNCKLRWSGMLHHWTVKKDGFGVYYLEATFIDDRQFLRFLLGPPNPALPIPVFQFPRVLPVFAPAKWGISFLILINLMRVQSNWLQLPDDPFNWSSWVSGFDPRTWQAHIKADSLLEDSSLWALLATRMNTMEEVISDTLDDAKLVMTYRRVFSVDGETPADVGMGHLSSMRNGALVFEVVDKSGYYNPAGTWYTGEMFKGLARSAVQFLEGFVESILTPVTDDQGIWPDEYYQQGYWGQAPNRPWIVLRDSKWSQIETGSLTWNPAGPVSVIVGGSNPYADQLASLAIKAVGNILGYFALAGFSSAGDIAESIIMPFLQGTILAWQQWKNTSRAKNLGWVHLWETYQQGGDNAWSLAAAAALKAGFEATESKTSHEFTMGVGPIYPGLHFMPGDRIGSTAEDIIKNKVFVDDVQVITLSWDFSSSSNGGPMWNIQVTVGTNEAGMSISERQARLVSKALATIRDIGVRMVT
ncbi:minor tail protein [Gordonia phage Syleon]|uniref:Minor tail protein n=2 Tax=Octobienvirus TaxID=3044779 RepID=A0A5Q2WGT7_9CAUD|nr:minor tail protein [Gordonia Phage Sephiroth]YP_010246687.1 minor tail protein [Gordonia phage Syleon]QGH75757.1 minor tail protein [Gordonia phage Syleon]QNN99372.1 minor tail protein [Gordonia Phage Sephiroth]